LKPDAGAAGEDRRLERRLVLGLSVSLLTVLAVAVWTYRTEQLVRQSEAWITHTHRVLETIDHSSALLDEVDAAQRGYVVTGEPLFLETYRASAAKLQPSFGEIRKVTADNPRQTRLIPLLQALTDQKIAFTEKVLKERQDRGMKSAATLISTNRGEVLKIRIRRVLDEMSGEEDRLLAQRTGVAQGHSRRKLVVLGFGILLQFAFLFAVFYLVREDLAERRRAAAAMSETVRLATFSAAVGAALTESPTLHRALEACAEAMVGHLGGAIASIWVVNSKELVLERLATSGDGVENSDALERIPVGQYRIGRIAAEGIPRILDLTSDPPEPGDKDWARRQGMVAFAGHPLTVAGRTLGVIAMFSREPITGAALHAMSTVADAIALGVDRARAADSLRASETLTRSIVEGMLEGLLTVDKTARIKSVNRAAERIFGYSRGELVGQPLSCLIPDAGGARPDAFIQEARIRAMGRVTEWQGRRKDGSIFPFELALFEFWTSEGRHYGGAVRDLSEHYEIERLKREFVSTVSHELRTPLTSIRGALGLVAGGAAGPLSTQAKGLLDIALKNSERLARLVNDILDIEKIEAGQLEFKMEELSVAPLLQAAVEDNRPYADGFGVALAVENGSLDARILADSDRLTQVITNLLSNAIKFSPKGETVHLVASARSNVVRIEVRDHGPGIPEEFRSRIFGRFQQADSSDTRQKGGTGLGLAITRLIVEQLGGTIGFETELGRGSTFWVELPAVDSVAARPRILHVEAGGAPRPRVLHVDDDPDLPTIVAAALSEFADVDVARGVREARERLAGGTYDVVVLDIGLPDGSGLELQPLLSRPGGPTPFVFFSAHEIPQDAAGRAAAVHVKSRSSVAALVESVKTVLAETAAGVDAAGVLP
jgi:PAS domain S-box-containing protein